MAAMSNHSYQERTFGKSNTDRTLTFTDQDNRPNRKPALARGERREGKHRHNLYEIMDLD